MNFKKYLIVLTVILPAISTNAQCVIGDSLMNRQNFRDAQEAYMSCWEKDTTQNDIRLSLANCLYQMGDLGLSKFHYHELEKDSIPEAISRLAAIYETQQNLPKAIKYYLALQKLYPGNPQYPRKLGNLFLQGNEPGQAIDSYKQALSINPNDLIAIQGLAGIYYELEKIEVADSLLEVGLELDSTYIGLALLRSRIQYRKKDYSAAAFNLLDLSGRTELSLFYNNLLGYALIQIDSLDKAMFFLRRTLQKEAKNEYALFYMGLAYEKKKEYEEALHFFDEASKAGISENMHLFHQGSARVNMHLGKYKAVIDHYSKSQQYKKEADVYFYMANAVEVGYKDKSRAIEYYNLFLKQNPDDTEKIKMAKERLKILKENKFMENK